LHGQLAPSTDREHRQAERRKVFTSHLLSNLERTSGHPTLKLLAEVADTFTLTMEGAHRLFGYDVDGIREFDTRLNGSRTHIVESYAFERDIFVDLPLEIAPLEKLQRDAMLRDLVRSWQYQVPIRALGTGGWRRRGVFYVRVGTADSFGSNLPAGAIALAEPLTEDERLRPDPTHTYLLQFSDGYRCSRCVVSHGKLTLLTSDRTYVGSQQFDYPSLVRIAGRIRMFALALPQPEYAKRWSVPLQPRPRDLILPWEHPTRASLLATKHRRFRRTEQEQECIQSMLKTALESRLSERSERRYRSHTSSDPHVNALIHLTVAHFARYTDVLRAGGLIPRDKNRFSLETLLTTSHYADVVNHKIGAVRAVPPAEWTPLQKEFVEWPALLSMKFPHLRIWEDSILRLAKPRQLAGLEPPLSAGSLLLLEKPPALPDTRTEHLDAGWSRSIFVLRRGLEFTCGYLHRDGNEFALHSGAGSTASPIVFRGDELSALSRVSGVAVPV
jgi:hypothetical protein